MKKILMILFFVALFLNNSALPAQELENVQVLPFETKRDIIPFMQNTVAKSLGVKCGFCHNVKDFSDDGNPHKLVAREMMRMMLNINDNMKTIQKVALNAGLEHWQEAPVIECWVCHRGSTEPEYVRP